MVETQRDGDVVDLRSRRRYKPDMGAFAREQVAKAREALRQTPDELANYLEPLLGWKPTGEMIESWEETVVPPGDVLVALSIATYGTPAAEQGQLAKDVVGSLVSERFADVTAVYSSRTDFTAAVPIEGLLQGAHEVRAMGLSLNLLCQHYADRRLRALVEDGARLKCLFLDPAGGSTQINEREEGYPRGHLAALTELNIQTMLHRVRGRLPEELRDRVEVATYDETIRFNLIMVDEEVCVAQPYLSGFRGLESPTFVVHRRWATAGLYPMFEQVFTSIWERSVKL